MRIIPLILLIHLPKSPPIIPDPNSQIIPQEVAIDTIATWSAQFLRATVLDDEAAFDFVFGGTGDELDSNVSVISQLSPDLLTPNLDLGDSSEVMVITDY